MGCPPASTIGMPAEAPPGRPHEANGNVRPRWMAVDYRIRLTGRLLIFFAQATLSEGSQKEKVEPAPGLVSTQIRPPCFSTSTLER